jgi:hypothetical protein
MTFRKNQAFAQRTDEELRSLRRDAKYAVDRGDALGLETAEISTLLADVENEIIFRGAQGSYASGKENSHDRN